MAEARARMREMGFNTGNPRVRYTDTKGGSYYMRTTNRITMGTYPLAYAALWFSIHELSHAVWTNSRRRPRHPTFAPGQPEDYWELGWRRGCMWVGRPRGYASIYAKRGGGEEAFCELVAFVLTTETVPADLTSAWDAATTIARKT